MYFDELYWLLIIAGLVLTILPQLWVKGTYNKYKKVLASSGLSGAEVARKILELNNIINVKVESTSGELSDHYDPSHKVVRLSPDIYNGRSISAMAIAAHEVGHAIQDNTGYFPMKMRAGIFPLVMFGQMLGPWLMVFGIMLRTGSGFGFGEQLAILGLVVYTSVFLFQFITLPVELNASARAMKSLDMTGYLAPGMETRAGRQVLIAAAFTYVAAALYSLIELAYWAYRIFGSRNRN